MSAALWCCGLAVDGDDLVGWSGFRHFRGSGSLLGAHVFGGQLRKWPSGFRERMEPRLREALAQVAPIFAELPPEWLYIDGDDSLPVQLDVKRVISLLELPFTEPDAFLDPAMSPVSVVCNYAILRFLPFPQTGEFVNVGVVVGCTQPAMLEFWMDAPGTLPRVQAFFPQVDARIFASTHAAMATEFERIRQQVQQAGDPKSAQHAFRELVRPRESMFRFGEVRTIMTPDPEGVAKDLFERYVRPAGLREQQPQAVPAS